MTSIMGTRELTDRARLLGTLHQERRADLAQLESIGRELEAGDLPASCALVRPRDEGLSATYSALVGRIENRLLASVLAGEAMAAREKGVAFELDPRSRFGSLPGALGETEMVSVVGNLLRNACDATVELPPRRRRVSLLLTDANRCARVRVRDWGIGLVGCLDDKLLTPGFTTKPGHAGVGLALVNELVTGAGGELQIERLSLGTAVEARIPDA
jgi:sensor histidine kinase regulating citrate/malate metabolism